LGLHCTRIKEKKLTNLPRSDRLERSRNPHDNFFRRPSSIGQ
jgi:hypothetical protein